MLGAGIREAGAGREGAEGSCGDLAFAVSEMKSLKSCEGKTSKITEEPR